MLVEPFNSRTLHAFAHEFEDDTHLLYSLSFPRVAWCENTSSRSKRVFAHISLAGSRSCGIHSQVENFNPHDRHDRTCGSKGSHLRNSHPVCSMRAAENSTTAETSDCSILGIPHTSSIHMVDSETTRQVPALIGMYSRNIERLKLQKQLPRVSFSSSRKRPFLFEARSEGLLCITLQFWFASALARSMQRNFARRSCSA